MRLYENKITVCTNFVLNFYQTMIYRAYYFNNSYFETRHISLNALHQSTQSFFAEEN